MTRTTARPSSPVHTLPGFPRFPALAGRRGRRPGRGAPVLVAVAHGSRDPRALRTVTALLDRVRAQRPGLRVELGHIELNEPLLPDTLAALPDGTEAVLVPLLFGRGHHVKHDIPEAVAAVPRLRARTAAPLGPHALLTEALHGRLTEAGWDGAATGGAGVVLAAAGSRDPDSLAGTERVAAQLSARLGGAPVLPAYASAAHPTVPEAVRQLRRRGCDRLALASCFTAPGRFSVQSAAAMPPDATLAAPLGTHPSLARLLLHRYDTTAHQHRTGPSPRAAVVPAAPGR